MSTFNCPRCNAENDIENAVCENCGLQFHDPPQDLAEYEGLPDEATQVAQPAELNQNEPPDSAQDSDKPGPDDQTPEISINAGDLDDWLRGLPSPSTADLGKVGNEDDIDGSLPTWLQEVRVTADQKGPAGDTGFGDWINDLEGQPPTGDETEEELPDWVSALTKPEQWPETEEPEALAEWLEDGEGTDDLTMPKTAELPGTAPLKGSHELDGVPDQLVGDSLPNWLMREAGVTSELESAESRPEDERASFREVSDSPILDRYANDRQEDLPEESGPSVDVSPRQSIDVSPETRAMDSAAEAATDATPVDDGWGWLEELDEKEVDAGLDEILEGDQQPVDDQDVEELLVDTTHAAITGIGRPVTEVGEETPTPPVASEEVELEPEVPESKLEVKADWLEDLEDVLVRQEAEPVLPADLPEDLEIERAEIPDWLAAVKPDEVEAPASRATVETVETAGPLTGLKGVIPLASSVVGARQVASREAYEVTKEHQQQVALLKQLVTAEPVMIVDERPTTDKDRLLNGRIILSLLLLIVILIGWFVPQEIWPSFLTTWTPTVATDKVYSTIDQAAGKNVLVAFEYTPAMAGELDLIADSMLNRLASNKSPVLTISQAAAGVVMAQQALDRSEVTDAIPIGLLPGDAVGLRGLSNCLNVSGTCRSVVNVPLDPDAREQLKNVALLVVLTSDRDSLVNWIEQVGTNSDVPMVAGLTQSLSPVASPYVTSEQLTGVIDGAPASIIYDYSQKQGPDQAPQILTSLTLAQWLFVVLLILGALYFGIFKRSRPRAGTQRSR